MKLSIGDLAAISPIAYPCAARAAISRFEPVIRQNVALAVMAA
jgi:hypothetical protein